MERHFEQDNARCDAMAMIVDGGQANRHVLTDQEFTIGVVEAAETMARTPRAASQDGINRTRFQKRFF
jgi:hypothetical protein